MGDMGWHGWRKRSGEHSKEIALVASMDDVGVILCFDGAGLAREIEATGRLLGDLFWECSVPDGVSIWEGTVVYSDADAEMRGEFRPLTSGEMVRLWKTGCPWECEQC